jgi:hypothetical protein
MGLSLGGRAASGCGRGPLAALGGMAPLAGLAALEEFGCSAEHVPLTEEVGKYIRFQGS